MITIVYGKPGCGKTTLLAYYAVRNEFFNQISARVPFLKRLLKPYDHVFCTDPSVQFTEPIKYHSIGFCKPAENSLYLLDEIGIGFNNRNWSKFTDYQKHFFALHRHLRIDVVACSQTVDVDISIRHRASRLFELHKFGPWSVIVPIRYKIGVNNDTHEIDEVYSSPHGLGLVLAFLLHKVKFLPRWKFYKYFNTLYDDFIYADSTSPRG